MEKSYTKLKKLSEKNGDIEFQAEVPVELLEEYSLAALAELAEDFALPGFRKGNVPQEKVREHIGEMDFWKMPPMRRFAMRCSRSPKMRS